MRCGAGWVRHCAGFKWAITWFSSSEAHPDAEVVLRAASDKKEAVQNAGHKALRRLAQILVNGQVDPESSLGLKACSQGFEGEELRREGLRNLRTALEVVRAAFGMLLQTLNERLGGASGKYKKQRLRGEVHCVDNEVLKLFAAKDDELLMGPLQQEVAGKGGRVKGGLRFV